MPWSNHYRTPVARGKASRYDAAMAGGYSEHPFVAEYYDHVVPYRERADVPFYVGLGRAAGGEVLELGSGTGRVLLPMARAGCVITGLDATAAMLGVCRHKLAAETAEVQARVTLVEGDMCRFDLGRTFALVTVPFRGFQHLLTVEDQLACLEAVRRHLRLEGRFVLDVFNPSLAKLADDRYLSEWGEEPEFTMPDGRQVVRRARVARRDHARQVLDIELIYLVTHPDGREERLVHAFPMRYFFRYEAEHLLARAGFRVEAVYGDYDRSPFGAKDPGEIIVVARR